MVIDLIHPESKRREGMEWLYEIVANPRNSVDVDKFDYLQRDSMGCGVSLSVDVKRLLQFVRVIDDEGCRWKVGREANL